MKNSEEYINRLNSDTWTKNLCDRICAHRDARRARQSRWAKISLVLVAALGLISVNYVFEENDREEMASVIQNSSAFVPVSYTID